MKDIIEQMNLANLFDYGSVIPASDIRTLFGIVMPESGTYQQFKDVELQELQVVGHIREQLLNEGKYIKREGENYRVLLPSENADQVRKMNDSANRKYNRALKLEHNTPKEARQAKQRTSVMSRLRDLKAREKRNQLYA
jgi:hypothetical protein